MNLMPQLPKKFRINNFNPKFSVRFCYFKKFVQKKDLSIDSVYFPFDVTAERNYDRSLYGRISELRCQVRSNSFAFQ